MIQYKSLRQYTHIVDGIRFGQNKDEPIVLIYFSENSTLLDDYPKLNLKLIDFRYVLIPTTKIPRTRLTGEIRKLYRSTGLIAYSSSQKPPPKNIILDLSLYLTAIDTTFKPTNYRQRAGFLIKNLILKSSIYFPKNFKKIFLYSIDPSKDMNTFINRKIFPIIKDLKTGEFQFQDMILNVIQGEGSNYRLLVKDKDFKFTRVKNYLRSIKIIDTEEEIKQDAKKAANIIMKSVSPNIPENKDKVNSAIEDFLNKDKESLDKVRSGEISGKDIQQIATASILYKVSGNLQKSKNISKKIPSDKKFTALKAVNKQYTDEIIEPQKTVSLNTDERLQVYDIPYMVGNKSPDHIFQKRQIDFETNLKNDMVNSFKVLERTDLPIKFKKLEIIDKPDVSGEIYKSDISIMKVNLEDSFGNSHNVSIEIPKIDPRSGVFKLNGRRKCLINQIVQCPITFPDKFESRFESSYSIFRIYSKRLKREQFLEAFMANSKLPLLVLLSYSFGFDETLRLYGIKFEIVKNKLKKDDFGCKINKEESIIFKNIDNELKRELCKSFIREKVEDFNIDENFGSKKYFEKIILKITGRVNTTYIIDLNIQNVVDPISKQILMNKQLPTDLNMIIKYMTEKVIQGFVIDRNDITNQRIRNSEVLVSLAQKQILAAYTIYREQILAGNKEAKFEISSNKTLNDFINTEIVVDMEYANPIEEMATMTRVSPIGKRVGGIPDKRAIQNKARNTHQSYFGNIDPVDTPESDNIGIIQQLTVDAKITSARGLLHSKDKNDKEGSGLLSTTTCMIPFIENNDGVRIMMNGSQAKQMIPLKNPEPPIVQSGYESILTNTLSDNFIKRAPCNGKIISIKEEAITIQCKDGKREIVDISPVHLRSGSGKNTLSTFIPTVKSGQLVKKGDIVAEGSCMSNGNISLGRTLCVAYMPYKGYNFEDGIVISDKLVSDNMLTSLHGIEEEILISEKDRILEISKIGDITKKGDILVRKTVGEIEELIGYEEDESIDIHAGQMMYKSQGGRIVDIEVFSNISEDKFPQLKDLINRTNKKYGKAAGKNFKIRGITIKGIMIKFKIEQELKIGLGDKLCNRFGNKGIISLVEKSENMPRTPYGDPVDIILNPLGVIGRMNIGQMYEIYCGLIAKELANKIPGMSKEKSIELLSKVLTLLDGSKSKEFSIKFTNNLRRMNDKQFKEFVDKIKETGFMPIIIPPFKSPGYKNIKQAMNVLGIETGYNLYLPEFKVKTNSKVPYGYIYISKLEHIGEMKIFARSTGPVSGKTAQPLSGKRMEGGQRLGELDSYSFISYNCTNILAELMGPLSDDFITRDEIISDIVQTGDAAYREPKISPARDLLNSYFVSLMLSRG